MSDYVHDGHYLLDRQERELHTTLMCRCCAVTIRLHRPNILWQSPTQQIAMRGQTWSVKCVFSGRSVSFCWLRVVFVNFVTSIVIENWLIIFVAMFAVFLRDLCWVMKQLNCQLWLTSMEVNVSNVINWIQHQSDCVMYAKRLASKRSAVVNCWPVKRYSNRH